ncbi:RHS repeat-associated core domain-containing protein [Geomonas anaerohicana]|uniref:PASTA domain-containing protein n=1 Tax=Geomonas anaerohicana TaxID=2798583 RepID=A0ABS0YGL8_9BACT|nr:RHS repeat-associated core domain-containing protein [Geomonas anaerohicana]MBJ6751481.1 PASTA domain-containing protein [Geomonas anaerohicana]
MTAELADVVADAKMDAATKKRRAVDAGIEVSRLDREIRKQLVQTTQRLVDADLPAEIRERHRAFVKHYEENVAQLKENIGRVEKAGGGGEADAGLERLSRHLQGAKAQLQHRKSGAERSLKGQPEASKREPRLKKEDFERDLKRDKHSWLDQRRIVVASTGSLAGLIGSDDLAENLEVQLTPEIRAKAQELEHNPVKIYNWVRNNIEYVPTWGSIQGAHLTLVTGKGNAFDTSSLLIALLRASGIHARYVLGTIEVPVDKAVAWVGASTDALATVELLGSAGTPVKPVYSGGAIQKVQLEHVWVEAWLDYLPSRGARHQAGHEDTWIPLDASFKLHNAVAGADFSAAAFDAQDFVAKLTGSATINEAEGYATGVQCSSVKQLQEPFRNSLQSFLTTERPGATVSQVVGSTEILGQEYPYLLGTLPYRTVVRGSEFSEIPESLRHSVTFKLVNNDTLSPNYSETTLSLTTSLPKLAGKRVTLSYSPATAADEAVLAAYGPRPHADGTPITLSEYPSSLPAYLMQVKAELRVDGVVVASGVGANLGGYEQLSIQISDPNITAGGQEFLLKAGEYLGIAFGLGPVSVQHLELTKTALEETAARLGSGKVSGLTKDDVIGSFLYASAQASLAEIDSLNGVRARVMGVAEVRRPSSSVVSLMFSTNYFFGIPTGLTVAGPSNAELGYQVAVAAKDGNRDKVKKYLIVSGLDASAAASGLQKYLLSSPQGAVTSLSAVEAMTTASEQSLPLYRVTPSNSSTAVGKLLLWDEVKQSVANDAGAGLTLVVPQRNVSIGNWSGVGYESISSWSGNNYSNLVGPPTLVQGLTWPGKSIHFALLPGNVEPPVALSQAIITTSFVDGVGGVSAGLSGLPATPAGDLLDLLTTSLLYDRLGDRLGCYVDLASPSVPTGACMATYLSFLCDAAGTPIIADKNGRPVADAGVDQVVGTGDLVTLDGSRSADPNNDPLVFQWRLVSVPQGSSAVIADGTTAVASFTADVAGAYVAELTVSDGKKTSLADSVTVTAYPAIVTIPTVTGMPTEDARTAVKRAGLSVGAVSAAIDLTVEAGKVAAQSPAGGTSAGRGSAVDMVISTGAQADTEAPAVKVTFDRSPALYAAGSPVGVSVDATDLVGISSVAMSVDGTSVAVTAPVTKIDTAGFAPGSIHTVEVTAKDISLNVGTASATFAILDPTDKAAPVIAIGSPVAGAAITAPADIVGTVTDNNLVEYTLAYAPAGKSPYTVFAKGSRPVVNGVLGRLDPTQMKNGLYDVVLTAWDANGNTSTYSTTYRVTGDLKVGNFTVSFTDVNIPLAGIPVTVTRSYDSRDKKSGDFGFGWNIDIQNVKTEENQNPGLGWSQISSGGDFPTYCVGGEGERYVAVTLPDGRVEEFDMTVTPKCQALVPIQYPTISYTPRPGTTSTIKARNVGQVYYSSSGVLFDLDSLEPYNPSQYTLTTADGAVYELDQNVGVRSVKDTNSNTLTYGSNGITHSSGKSVSFARDLKGRITHITDPSGKPILFSYDADGNLASVTDQAGNVTRYTYNASHGLIDIIDPLGRRAVRNEYDNSGRLTAHIDAEGKRIEYTHDIAGRQEVVKDRNGNVTVFIYDEQGRVLKKTDPLGKSVSYSYDSVGNKLSETDPLGNKTTWTYDAKRNVLSETKVIDGQALKTTHTYNSLGKLLTTTDPLGHVTTNSYDANGNLLTTTDALGNVTKNSYDAKGNVLSTTDALNHTTSYEYDSYGNMTRQTTASGAVTTYVYDSRGNKLTETDPRGNVRTNTYDANGRLLATTSAPGITTKYEYDKAGNKVAETSPLGLVTSYVYDSANRLIETKHADGTSTKAGYDAEGNRVTSTDQLGRVTTSVYNANKQLVKTIYPDETTKLYGYDAAGRQTSVTDALGNVTTKEYDILGRMVKTIDPEGHATSFEYDGNGNQVKQIDANGHATSFVYDALNRLTATILPGGQKTTVAYDELGRKASETDAAGITTQFSYDASGNLASVTDAMAGITRYEYDLNNNRTAIVDARGNRTTFTFDAQNRMASKTMPNGGVESYGYDAAGNRIAKTDAKGQKIEYAYDSKGRLLTRLYPDGSTVKFSYTNTGKRATAIDKRGTTSYTYDTKRDRLLQVTNPDGKGIGYTYNANANIGSISSFAGTISYIYTSGGRLREVRDPQGNVTTYTYDAAGNRTGLAYPNGTSVAYTYDINNRLTNLSHKNPAGQFFASYSYTLGAAGNRTKIDELSGISRQYTYDNLYRLTREQVVDPANTQTYSNDFSYDAVGNRQNKTYAAYEQPAVSTDYTYNNADQLLTENGITYTYDLNGNLASKTDASGTTTYSYNYDDRMVNVVSLSGAVAYHYDVDGNRVGITTAAGDTWHLVDTNRSLSQVIAEYKADSSATASYTYADNLISMSRGGQTFYYHFDGLGSIRQLTNATATNTDKYEYDAFGASIVSTGTTSNDFLFNGQQYDPSLGFYHLRARYYQPSSGRFTALDPFVGDPYVPVSLHKYAYSGGDPVNKIDPTGLMLEDILEANLIRLTIVTIATLSVRELLIQTQATTTSSNLESTITTAIPSIEETNTDLEGSDAISSTFDALRQLDAVNLVKRELNKKKDPTKWQVAVMMPTGKTSTKERFFPNISPTGPGLVAGFGGTHGRVIGVRLVNRYNQNDKPWVFRVDYHALDMYAAQGYKYTIHYHKVPNMAQHFVVWPESNNF